MAQRKVFRIEEASRAAAGLAAPGDDAGLRHRELVAELKALRRLIEQSLPQSRRILELCQAEMVQARALQAELAADAGASELGSIPAAPMERLTRELDAVVSCAEQAAHRILSAAEEIDRAADAIGASADHAHHGDAIQERLARIFEACSFHDLTGQRIGKVVAALRFVEQHMQVTMELWQALDDVAAGAAAPRDALHGPALAGESGHKTQAEIDALFL